MTSIKNVIEASDKALLSAKRLGKNCVVKYTGECQD
jgi:PleD family two-component response regulator